MYCIIGEKILSCEVKKSDELFSVCKVGGSKKEQSIANNRLFKTEEEATQSIKKRRMSKMNENKQVAHAVEVCKALYEKLYEETGIEVRTIDRQWTVNAAEKHIIKLKRTLLDKPETHGKNVSKSFSIAPNPKKQNQRVRAPRESKSSDSRNNTLKGKDSEKNYSDKKYSDKDKMSGNRHGRNNAQGNNQNSAKGNMKNHSKNSTSGKYTNK